MAARVAGGGNTRRTTDVAPRAPNNINRAANKLVAGAGPYVWHGLQRWQKRRRRQCYHTKYQASGGKCECGGSSSYLQIPSTNHVGENVFWCIPFTKQRISSDDNLRASSFTVHGCPRRTNMNDTSAGVCATSNDQTELWKSKDPVHVHNPEDTRDMSCATYVHHSSTALKPRGACCMKHAKHRPTARTTHLASLLPTLFSSSAAP